MEIIRSAQLGSGIAGQLSEALWSAAALVDDLPQWDMAVGAGIDHTISEELAVVALRGAPLLVTSQARLSGHYAAPVLPPAGAPPSAQLLAATGRQQRAQP